jgi:hypothetical protein
MPTNETPLIYSIQPYNANVMAIIGDKIGIGNKLPNTKLDVSGVITAQAFIAGSGESSQFLKADGSLDSKVYQDVSEKGVANGYVPLDESGLIPVEFISISGETTTSIVYQTGDQNISGIKNFESNPQFNGVNLSTELYSIAIAIALG